METRSKTQDLRIPFNRPYMTGNELRYIADAHENGRLAGRGAFTIKCCNWLEQRLDCKSALLVHSCTGALEMAAMLIDVQPGDEIIMPSFTFVSTANAFVLRGGVPVFVDIRPDTLNIDESKIEAAITSRTKAIVPVHYAGVACEMDVIMELAHKHNLVVIEDAAQGIMSSYKGRPLGSIGHMAAISFHETKNIISGEGGALIVNDPQYLERADILLEKGTNRAQFSRGEVDKYTWVDIGSSYPLGELCAAFLWAQMEEAESITARRLNIWNHYHEALQRVDATGKIRRPIIPAHCHQNGHMYYVILDSSATRTSVIDQLKSEGIDAVFHYVPLHGAPGASGRTRISGRMSHTEDSSSRLLRLPLWVGMEVQEINRVTNTLIHLVS